MCDFEAVDFKKTHMPDDVIIGLGGMITWTVDFDFEIVPNKGSF